MWPETARAKEAKKNLEINQSMSGKYCASVKVGRRRLNGLTEVWTVGWPPEENQLSLELISDLTWSAGGVTDQGDPVPCGRGLEPVARGGTTTETTTRRCLRSGARGREGLRSLSICCHRTSYGVVGWFLLF